MKHSPYSIKTLFKLLAIIAMALAFAVIIKNGTQISQSNELIQHKQLQTLSHILITQASLSAGHFITNNEQERLLKLANQFASDPLIFDASIYDEEGVKLAASDNALGAHEATGLATPLGSIAIGRQQLIEPIYNEDTVVGFVRLTFEKGKVTAYSDHHYRTNDRSIFLMLLLAFCSGVTLPWLLNRKR